MTYDSDSTPPFDPSIPDRIDPYYLELAEKLFLDPIRESRSEFTRSTLEVKGNYDEVFSTELEGWCYGLSNFPGEIFTGLVHRVVTELQPLFCNAIRNNLVFNLSEVARKISKAAKYLVPEKEIAFSILAQIPDPKNFDEDGQYVIAMIIDQAEESYGGALDRMQRRWNLAQRRKAA